MCPPGFPRGDGRADLPDGPDEAVTSSGNRFNEHVVFPRALNPVTRSILLDFQNDDSRLCC
jgi:hypothetical protein